MGLRLRIYRIGATTSLDHHGDRIVRGDEVNELLAAKLRILQSIRIVKQEEQLLREALELIDRQIKKRPDVAPPEPHITLD